MQQTHTHKAVTLRVEAKKLLSRRRQSEYSFKINLPFAWAAWTLAKIFWYSTLYIPVVLGDLLYVHNVHNILYLTCLSSFSFILITHQWTLAKIFWYSTLYIPVVLGDLMYVHNVHNILYLTCLSSFSFILITHQWTLANIFWSSTLYIPVVLNDLMYNVCTCTHYSLNLTCYTVFCVTWNKCVFSANWTFVFLLKIYS